MASNVTNRQTIRERLASKIDTALDSTWDVFNYGTISFNGKARNVVVASSDTEYPQDGAGAEEVSASDADFDFAVTIFILYASDGQSWTPQNSQDALDLGRKLVTDVLRDNRKDAGYWNRLSMVGKSRVSVVPDEAGVPYRYETIFVRTEIYA